MAKVIGCHSVTTLHGIRHHLTSKLALEALLAGLLKEVAILGKPVGKETTVSL